MFNRNLLITLLLASCFIQNSNAKQLKPSNDKVVNTISYVADKSTVFPNPERGWHVRVDVDGRGKDDRDFKNVKAAGHTLLHSYLRLDDFKETDQLPQSYLDKLQEALDTIRAQGLKIILRPTHVWSEKPSVPYERIFKHIDQLNAVISKNADVVNHLEVGYLGKWGEWHSGLYTELSNRSDGNIRYKIIERILNTTPNSLPIAMRYPMHLKEVLEVLPTPEGSKALTQVQKDRVGHHGDCFLYDEHDRGTYARLNIWFGDQTLQQQKEYTFNLATSFGANKLMGGETCSSKIERIDDTQTDMAKANWTEINISFWEDAIEMWKKNILPTYGNDPEESEFNRISRKLGYRLRLIDATLPTEVKAGKKITFSANLSNDGYAGIIKSRPIFLVFDNGSNRYDIELKNVDVRMWLSGNNSLSAQTIKLPHEMVSGKYKVAMWLPDASDNLRMRPEYAVRFANTNVWNAAKGYNILTETLIVK